MMDGTQGGLAPENGDGPINWIRMRVVLLCFLLNVLDGADVLVVSYAAPAISAQWNLSPETLGVLFSAGLVGMTAGAIFLAPLADRAGRKPTVLVALALIGLGMVASSYATGVEMLAAIRVIVGLGIGAMLATTTALAAEFAPDRYKAFAITFSTAGYPIGAVLAGVAAGQILPQSGWQTFFMLTGLVSLAMVPVCMAMLPESPGFLIARRPAGALEKVNKLHTAMQLAPLEQLPETGDAQGRASVGQVLARKHRTSALLVWLAFFASFATLYFLTSWIPKLAVDAGMSLDSAIYAGATFNFGAVVGVLTLGWLATIGDLSRVVAWFFVAAFLSMLIMGLGMLEGGVGTLLVMLFVVGAFVQGGFGGLYAVAARIYPAEIRTTGVGWSIGAGRLGAVAGPMVGGALIGAGASLSVSFAVFAVPMLVAAIALLFIVRHASAKQAGAEV